MKDPLTDTHEPIAWASLATVVAAILAVAISFGLDVSDAQQNAILGLVTLVQPVVIWLWARRHTTPTADPMTDDGTRLVPAAPPHD